MKKITLLLSMAGAIVCSSASFAASDESGANISYEDSNNVGKQLSMRELTPTVSVAPFMGVPSHFDGSELIVNNPSINDDLKLLQLRQAENALSDKASDDAPFHPRLIFTGNIEGQASIIDPYSGDKESDLDLTAAELDTFVEASDWVNGYISLTYDNGANGQANRTNNSSFNLSQGFLTVGDLDKSPVYGTVGQLYVPFGKYSSFMITSPQTKTLGRTKPRALVVGYSKERAGLTPHAEAFVYRGATQVDSNAANSQIREYGFNVGASYSKEHIATAFGASFTSNIAESDGLQGDGSSTGFAQQSGYENLDRDVPAFDVYGKVSYLDYTFLGEYVAATTNFSSDDLSYDNKGAEPKALDLQAAYAFEYWRPSYVAVDFGRSWQALAVGLPKTNVGFSYGVNIWSHTLLSFEFMHKWGYPNGSTATGPSNSAVDTGQVGESYDSATLQFDMYF